ncbi:TPA: conjugal transfer protein [Clostridioides difficile]|nr:conjugal transfer protein [Clostridioides difficile]
MSMYLFDEQPIVANKTLAREIGLNEALILQQINYWIEINKKSGKNYHDGKYWTYNSIRAWQENDFDYMSFDTVKRTFSKLEKAGYLLVGNYNKDPRDKTKWYTINNDKLEELYVDMELKKQKIQTEALKKSMPNTLGQNAPMDKGKINQCNNADCTNAQVQNALMQRDNLHQSLPENTTNNTTNNSADISIHPSIKEKNQLFSENMKGRRIDISYKNIYQNCLEELRHQTGYYEHMSIGNKIVAEEFDEILKILADVMVLDDESFITINQTKISVQVVKERFRELNSGHLEYLVGVLRENEYKIRNIRAFVLTAAYNAPTGIDAYYSALVSYDMRGGY